MRRLLFCLLLVTFPLAGMSQPAAPGVVSLQYGYFCAQETIEQKEASRTISGVVNMVAGPPDFIQTGALVPAELGVGFGVVINVRPEFGGEAILETIHPPMGPNGITHEQWATTFDPEDMNYNGFTFEHDYELVHGVWTLVARNSAGLVYRVEFTIVDPALMPPTDCPGTPMLSGFGSQVTHNTIG